MISYLQDFLSIFFQRNDTRFLFFYSQQKLRREKIKRNTIVKNKIQNEIKTVTIIKILPTFAITIFGR